MRLFASTFGRNVNTTERIQLIYGTRHYYLTTMETQSENKPHLSPLSNDDDDNDGDDENTVHAIHEQVTCRENYTVVYLYK